MSVLQKLPISSRILISLKSGTRLWTENILMFVIQLQVSDTSSDTCCRHLSSNQVISSQHACRQTISPRQSASYLAAVDDTSPVRGDSNLHRLNSSVSIHTTSQKSPSHECVKVCVYMCMFILCPAITEGVGLATVTNTSQPLKSQRPRHLQCLLKTLRKNTTQKHPINFQN